MLEQLWIPKTVPGNAERQRTYRLKLRKNGLESGNQTIKGEQATPQEALS